MDAGLTEECITSITCHFQKSRKAKMVAQCDCLYDNQSIQGTLYISVDDSKFLLKFYESLKVEVSLDQESSQHGDVSLYSTADSKSVKSLPWGHYIDLSQLPVNQSQKSAQTVIKAENGQFIPIIPLNLVNPSTDSKETGHSQIKQNNIPDSLCSVTFTDSTPKTKGKKRKLSKTKQQNEFSKSQSGINSDRKKQISETKEIGNGENNYSCEYYQGSEDVDSNLGPGEENMTSSLVKMDDEMAENDLEEVIVSNLKLHSCSDCCGSFKTKQALKEHRKVKMLSEYNCDECCEVFPFKAFVQVHKKSNHGTAGASLVFKDDQYWYSCDICSTLVKTLVKLQIHTLSHTGEGYFQCCICDQKFGEKVELRQHMKCHKSNGKIRCRWCNKWFVDKQSLAKHKLTCKEIRCHLCGNTFPNKTSRNQHYKDFHPNDILKCEICPYMFSSQEELDTHMMKHSRFKKKQCTLCGLFFSRLKKHMLIHKTPGEITENEFFYCDKCPAKFTNQSTFNRHRQNHMGDKPYQCPNCPRTFANCGVLYKHIKRHATLLPYACEVCEETCESINHLKAHMLTHSQDNILFPCSVCTQSFMYRNSLENHMQLKHPEVFSSGFAQTTTVTVTESDAFKAAHEISTVTAFTDSTNGIMEVVIPGITGLTDGQTADFEIVIVEK